MEAGDRSKGRGFATSFDFLPADDFGVVSGEVSPDPSLQVRCRRRRGRSVSESSPVSCLFTSCKMHAAALRSAAEAEQSGARRVAQDERLGWQRCSASADQGGAAADRPDSSVHLNLKPKLHSVIPLRPLRLLSRKLPLAAGQEPCLAQEAHGGGLRMGDALQETGHGASGEVFTGLLHRRNAGLFRNGDAVEAGDADVRGHMTPKISE